MRRSSLFVRVLCGIGLALSATESRGSVHSPVLYVHGLGDTAERVERWEELEELFRDRGYRLHVARLPRAATPPEAAAALNEEIARLLPAGPFHLVAKSMGGLGARLAIHRYGLGARALSLTTLATPHRGSSVADWVMKHVGKRDPLGVVMKWFLGPLLRSVPYLTTAYLPAFNAVVKNDPRVRYFSMGFHIPRGSCLHGAGRKLGLTHAVARTAGDEYNDGLVSLSSAAWGEVIAVLPSDHFSVDRPNRFHRAHPWRNVFHEVLDNLDRRF